MLSQAYSRAKKAKSQVWLTLEEFFGRFDESSTAVLSMNWDTVFERGVETGQALGRVSYGCDATPVSFKDGELIHARPKGGEVHILKPHGSVNWLYCDACRETFWVRPSETEQVAQTLFRRSDWEVVLRGSAISTPRILAPSCPHCKAESLGTRFATFSYRKALDFPMHAASWRVAEKYLKGAVDWIFIGYSMPAADFEFKHLLKRVQLTEKTRPRITVISGGDRSSAEATATRFAKFFGDVPTERFFFTNGMDKAAMDHLAAISVLAS